MAFGGCINISIQPTRRAFALSLFIPLMKMNAFI
jgi:hypothetical protein